SVNVPPRSIQNCQPGVIYFQSVQSSWRRNCIACIILAPSASAPEAGAAASKDSGGENDAGNRNLAPGAGGDLESRPCHSARTGFVVRDRCEARGTAWA